MATPSSSSVLKKRLYEDIQDLPSDKLEGVVKIIKKSNPELAQQDDEIEFDIQSFDLKTLLELDRFVTEYKESKKKEEEQGLGAGRDTPTSSTGKTSWPKLEGKDAVIKKEIKKELTFDEKRILYEDIKDLPSEKIEEVVEIIKKSNPELAQQDDIDLDIIQSFDLKTHWELYRFVTEYKEIKKKEEQGLGAQRDTPSSSAMTTPSSSLRQIKQQLRLGHHGQSL